MLSVHDPGWYATLVAIKPKTAKAKIIRVALPENSILEINKSKPPGKIRFDVIISKPIDTTPRLRKIWNNMKYRCSSPIDRKYEYYGGKGIRVCQEWGKSYQAFKDWALANGYADDLTIDRINPDGDYCPENCRWISADENRKHRKLTL